ncbi:MAG: GIY-YIG nuclease family protein [Thermoproteota archaeon]
MRGSYILIILVGRNVWFKPGSLPRVRLPPGCYIYVGSAMGPGGFEKRVLRHLRKNKRTRWHIDYLTRLRSVKVASVIYTPFPHGESRLTRVLSSSGFVKVVKGFGATDSPSDFSHLLFSEEGLRKTVRRIALAMRRDGLKYRIFSREALISLS